jgi:vitamin B12 transporter
MRWEGGNDHRLLSPETDPLPVSIPLPGVWRVTGIIPMVIFFVLLAIFFTTSAAAEPNLKLETLTVTAHRLPTADNILPIQVRESSNRPAIGADALRDLPSLAISQAGNLGSLTQVRIRGAEANHLMVLMDGVELNDPATDSSFNFANLALTGSNHLELLAGAHSAIWGSDALAGVLNVVTVPSERVRALNLEAGSFDTRHVQLQLAEGQENGFYNLSVGDFNSNGTNIAEVTSGNHSEKDGFEQRSYLFSGGLNGEVWSGSTLLRRLHSNTDFDPTPFPSFQPVDGDNESRHDEDLASVTIDWHGVERLEQRLQVSYLQTENRSYLDGLQESETTAERTKATAITRFRPGDRQAFTLLLEHDKEQFRQRGLASFFGDPNQQQTVKTNSVALEYIATPLPNFAFSLSARHDDNSEFDNRKSYRAAASYQLQDDLQIWASWGTGIKNPSFVERYGFTPDTFLGNPDLKPELNRHLSTGIRYQPDRWSMAITLFRDRLKDEIDGFAFAPELGGFTSINESGTSRRDGAELEFSADLKFATLSFGVSYLDAEEPDGSSEIRRPDWQGFATLLHARGPLSAEVSAFRVDNQDDFDFSTFPAARVSLKAYTLLRARVAYQLTERLHVAVRGQNLLDDDYQDQLGYRSPGRGLYLQLGADF